MAQTDIFAGAFAKKVLDVLGNSGTLSFANLYLGLLTAVGTQDGGTGSTEFTSYTVSSATNRALIQFGTCTVVDAQSYQSITTTNSQSFLMNSGVSTTILGIVITTAQAHSTALNWGSGGNVVWFGSIDGAGTAVAAGNTLTFNTGQITIKLY
jgi:hypothetical protein